MIVLTGKLIRVLTLAVAFLFGGPTRLTAQENSANPLTVKHRNDCRLAAQVLTTGEPHTKRDWAREYIPSCPVEGPPGIVQEWRTVPGDTAVVIQLVRASTAIHDARIYEQVRMVAADRSRPDVVRVGAMHVLDNYVAPHHAGWFSIVPPADGKINRINAPTALLASPIYRYGTMRVPAPVDEPVLELLQRIGTARDVEPVTVWYSAAALAQRIQWRIERRR